MGESIGYLLILLALTGGAGVAAYFRVRAHDRAEDELVARVARRVLDELDDETIARAARRGDQGMNQR